MKGLKNAHTPKSSIGMGDYYGQGVKNPTGRVISSSMDFGTPSKSKLKKPPKSLA